MSDPLRDMTARWRRLEALGWTFVVIDATPETVQIRGRNPSLGLIVPGIGVQSKPMQRGNAVDELDFLNMTEEWTGRNYIVKGMA